MGASVLVIVSGPPGSGKTTIARRIAREFKLPMIAKDDIKESLFDNLGWKDRDWSMQLGGATYALIFYFIESQLAAGRSHLVESNFSSQSAPKFQEIKEKYDFVPFQIQLKAKEDILFQRFKARWESGNRHPGHVDDSRYDDLCSALLKGDADRMDLGGITIELDTNDFSKINYPMLFNAIEQELG